METSTAEGTPPVISQWFTNLPLIGQEFASRAAQYDRDNTFVFENYATLKEHRFFSAMIPQELGGGGLSYADMCNSLRQLAYSCSSTALAVSMHQHLVAANVWKYRKGQGAEELLKKIAANQLVLVSTGAGDWLDSNGTMEKTEGGYLVSAQKHFASQSPVGSILVTSAPYLDPEKGWQVFHFPVPFTAEGLTVKNDWNAMGMRGTGSHTVVLQKVFVPETAIVLRRPQGEFHPFWNVVLTAAMPLIMSVYVGIAERAAELAISQAKTDQQEVYLLGEMQNELTVAQIAWKDMLRINNNLDYQPINAHGNDMLMRKTIIANACKKTVVKAVEAVGGRGYLQSLELERLFRDVQAAPFHLMQEKAQQAFTGNYLLVNQQTAGERG